MTTGIRSSRISRRSLLTAAAAATATATAATSAVAVFPHGSAAQTVLPTPAPTVDLNGTTLRILMWNHVLSDYNSWFAQFAANWGQALGVSVYVDFADAATISNAVRTELATKSGHDLIEHIAPMPEVASEMIDLTDVVNELIARHGTQLDFCRQDSFDPQTGRFYGLTHGYAPTAFNYRQSWWAPLGYSFGPGTYDELVRGAVSVWQGQGAALGLGMSNELDSNTAALSALWAHGGSIQDANGTIAINSDETVQLVELYSRLYQQCMLPDVFQWDITSNNQGFQSGQLSSIVNALSAYRTTQQQQPDTAKDMMLRAPLTGPAGADHVLAPAHARFISMIPQFSSNQDAAKEFLLFMIQNYNQITTASHTYNFPAFPSTVRGLMIGGGPLDVDPNHPDQGGALSALKNSGSWTTHLGWPGPTNSLVATAVDQSILPAMLARAAKGELSPKDAVAEAEARLKQIAAG
jgi:multiple sugar transport system substrate-binding protein